MHILVAFPLDDATEQDILLANVRKGLGSSGKDCDLLPSPALESEPIDCLFDAEERLCSLESIVQDTIKKYRTSYRLMHQTDLVDTHILGKTFDHFIKSFQWDSSKYPLGTRMNNLLSQMEEEVKDAIEAHKSKDNSYSEEKRKKEALQRKNTGLISDLDINHYLYKHKPEDVSNTFFKKYYVGVRDRLKEKDISALSQINKLFIESRTLLEKCKDGELYEILGSIEDEEEITKEIEFLGYLVKRQTIPVEEYSKQEEEEEQSLLRISEIEEIFTRMILARLQQLYSLLIHVKQLGLNIEAILRFGLPSTFCVFVVEYRSLSKILEKWKKISKSWKHSNRLTQVSKEILTEENEPVFDFIYKTIDDFRMK
ncbi:V-type H+-transporting ATPase subunit C [Nematocida sp. AWRm80]|nr:V-type H+-transporting ATPase subunit C [Nematocida sp. AWRm80]